MPLLFLIYINDIHHASKKFNFINYADDTTLLSNLNDFSPKFKSEDIGPVINKELHKISLWLQRNSLTLNVDKTKILIYHNFGKKFVPLTIKINNIILEIVEEFNFLGLTINKSLSWKSHKNKVANKIGRINGVINYIKKFVPTS